MEIRIGKKKDMENIQLLYQILFSEMSILQPFYYQIANQNSDYLLSVLKGKNSDVLVVQHNNQIIGFALVEELKTPSFHCVIPHKYAYLMDLVVHPKMRGYGVGTLLLEAVKKWAKKRNLDYVELTVLSENSSAIRFYEKEHFHESMKTMRFLL